MFVVVAIPYPRYRGKAGIANYSDTREEAQDWINDNTPFTIPHNFFIRDLEEGCPFCQSKNVMEIDEGYFCFHCQTEY